MPAANILETLDEPDAEHSEESLSCSRITMQGPVTSYQRFKEGMVAVFVFPAVAIFLIGRGILLCVAFFTKLGKILHR